VSQTLAISMMAVALVVLSVVMLVSLALAFLASVLVRESRKLDGVLEFAKRVASLDATVDAIRKSLSATDELVMTKLNRIATTDKRSRKKQAEEVELADESLPAGLWFPDLPKDRVS